MREQRDILKGLEKGLDVLAMLNQNRGMRVVDVARELGLPRTTTLRILGTLCANGFVERSESDRRFRPTIKVRTLADGYDDEAWLAEIAVPELRALTKEIVWPALIATPFGTSMVWRANTDHETSLTLVRLSVGMEAPVLGSASGRVYLAYCTEQERISVVDILRFKEKEFRHLLAPDALDDLVVSVRREGCAMISRPSEYSLAVPILLNDRYIASLAIRVFMRAMSATEVVQRYRETLIRVASSIASKMIEPAKAGDIR